jgi:uncharacterized membrane protein YfcA
MPDGSEPLLWLCLAALAAGAVNSLAGGGTLLTFPALTAALAVYGNEEAKVYANATSTVALVTGSVAGAWGYRREMRESRRWLEMLLWPSLGGGVLGALLLTRLDPKYFAVLIPWLILAATLLFVAEPLVRRRAAREPHVQEPQPRPTGSALPLLLFQFGVATYGGYFGAGIGILMISGLALMGVGDIHQINSLKTVLAACINTVAVVIFIPRHYVRGLVIAIGFGLAGYYFWR